MNLVWLDLNCSYAHTSLALPALHAQCREKDSIHWQCIRATTGMPIGETVKSLYEASPHIIAATAWLFTIESLLHILSRVKSLLPGCKIILGGPEFLGPNELFLRKNPFIDCVFRGEGETGFGDWLDCWNRPGQWNEIAGLCWIDSAGSYQDNGKAEIKNFPALEPPENSPFFNWEKPFVQLETARGCFNTCFFCVSGREKPVRALPVTQIREQLKTIRDHGIRDIRLLDRTFNYDTRRAIGLLNIFREFPGLHFHLEIHPGLLPQDLRNSLTEMPPGMLHLEAGIQSLREKTLKASGRAGSAKASVEGLRFLCSLPHLQTHADLIAGLPLYTLEELIEDTLTLARMGAGEIQLELLKVLPGTRMREKANEWELQYAPYPPYEILRTPHITPDELQTARRLSRLLDNYYNIPEWQPITRKLISEIPGFLNGFLNFLEKKNVLEQPLSQDRRGLLLYEYLKTGNPDYLTDCRIAWLAAGLSHKKEPAAGLRTKGFALPAGWDKIFRGHYRPTLRMAILPTDDTIYWFGFDSISQKREPVFIAATKND